MRMILKDFGVAMVLESVIHFYGVLNEINMCLMFLF